MYTEKEVERLLQKQIAKTVEDLANKSFGFELNRHLELDLIKLPQKDRRTGKTTRLVDDAIQYLFKHKKLVLSEFTATSDFIERNGICKYEQRCFINRVIKRLENEHFRHFKVTNSFEGIEITV